MENDRRGLCIASMVLGIVGIMLCSIPFISVICSILAIVFAGIGLRSTKSPGFAKAGLITGICGIVIGALVMLFYFGLARLFELTPGDNGFYYHYDSRDDDDELYDDDEEWYDDDGQGRDDEDIEEFYDFFDGWHGHDGAPEGPKGHGHDDGMI